MQQKMALNAQMRQSIQLLRMAGQELNEYINASMEKNPFLQREELKKKLGLGKDHTHNRIGSAISPDYTEKEVAQPENPRSSLLSQVNTLDMDDKIVEIAEYIIDELDDNGYIQTGLEEIAGELAVGVEDAEKALSIIQALDPAGIGARDVRECLQLQLKRLGKERSLEYTIVTDLTLELAKSDIKKIARSLNIDENAVSAALKNIKKLNPRPASTLLSKTSETVIPDLVASLKNKKLRLELNRESVPRLRLYNPYEEKLDIIMDEEVKEFLKNNMNAAKQLLDGLKRREETMCRVANFILKFQLDCLENGLSRVKGLTLQDVAKALELHPSTISRTVSNKYIQINDKVMPLKNFLSHSVRKENGETASKTSVKHRIKGLIDSEDKTKPLSDSAITARLKSEGILIERRTVAKYRESLKILPTHLRRKR